MMKLWMPMALVLLLAPALAGCPGFDSSKNYSVDPEAWSQLWLLFVRPLYTPQWSPDGAHIVFTGHWDDSGQSTYVAASDGSSVRRISAGYEEVVLLSDLYDVLPDISPDGSRIVYTTSRHPIKVGHDAFTGRPAYHPNLEIETSGLDGSDPRRLTVSKGLVVNTAPAWSPEGRRIAFVKTGYTDVKDRGIYIMSSDGSEPRRIVAFPSEDDYNRFNGADIMIIEHLSGPMWSPRRRFAGLRGFRAGPGT